MHVAAGMSDRLPLGDVAGYAQRVERLGFDALHVAETVHDSFMVALLALEATERLTVRTSVTLAFTRSPMLVALAAWDLARVSRGRFQLGLGTQIRPNIEDRYGMPWSAPVPRLREYVAVVHEAWRCFRSGDSPAFTGTSYRFTRLQPRFRPEPLEGPDPAVWIGGINDGMVELAGEVAAGLVTHPTNSHPRFLRDRARPALARGAARRADGGRAALLVGGPVLTAPDPAGLAQGREHQRRTLAFLLSTPAYAPTLELLGLGPLGPALRVLVRERSWDGLGALVDDDLLDVLVPTATWDDLPGVLAHRYGGLADGLLLRAPDDPALDTGFGAVVAAVRGI